MSSARPIEDLFGELIELQSVAERQEYLERVCGDDQRLREQLERLLAQHQRAGSFLDVDEPLEATEVPASRYRPGEQIGPYKLREQIGEGGMGTVYVAEQQRPLRRKVALKVIKPGMDSQAVIARFEAERNALALMNHPNIARVFDAGTTEQGHPYFVMELVSGIPLTDYCDEQKLTIRERLGLFTAVCQAIQHAHQKGVIHRDIKPTNVLVTELDGEAIPKVIDFGVAKALNQTLTERSIYTSFQAIIGTPMYMSPEQASLSAVDVDTRSDVYSLGVLLYELLTGTTPFDWKELRNVAQDEILRFIREREPPRPSNRLSTLGDTATRISQARRTQPQQLGRQVRGELDWIVMKALEKDRKRRYETASELSKDVANYLNDELVTARPPSLLYQSLKFARRNRTAAVTTALVLVSLVFGVISTTWMRMVAQGEAARANRALKSLSDTLYEKAVLDVLMNRQDMAQESLRLLQGEETVSSKALVLMGLMALNRGEYDQAVGYAEQAIAQDVDDVSASALLTVACIWAGYDDRGERELHRLQAMKPLSDVDRLLKALASLSFDPDESKRLLDACPAVKHSPVGLMILAFADSAIVQTMKQQDAAAAEKTARDFEYVQFLFGNTPASLSHRVFALALAARLAQSEGRLADADRYIEEGREPAKELITKADSYPAAAWSCQHYYQASGDDEQAWLAIRKAGHHGGTYCWFLAAHCLQRFGADAIREFDKAVAREHRERKYVRLARAYLIGWLPERRDEIEPLVEDMLDDPSPFLRRHALLAMWPVWSARQIRDRAAPTSIPGLWYDAECLNYLARRCDESQLLEQASNSENDRHHAHFTLAMLCLADGRGEDARQHFDACVALNQLGWFDHEWARGYLVVMDAGASPVTSQ